MEKFVEHTIIQMKKNLIEIDCKRKWKKAGFQKLLMEICKYSLINPTVNYKRRFILEVLK
jgi:hypothetical protein